MAKLEKKIALVTGGAKGIGRAIALKLALEGAYVVINYRGSIAQAEETLKLIEQSGGNACIKACDISDFSKAKSMIEYLTADVEVGKTYEGEVKRIMNFGAFIEILPGKEGLLHISKIANHRVDKVEDVMNIGDKVVVKVTEIDNQNRINLSRKELVED